MSTYQQQLAKCKDTTDDYSNIWRSSVWTITDYEELFVDIDRGYIIQTQGWGNYFIINPEWEEEESDSEDEEEDADTECVNCDRCYKKIPYETEITVRTKRNTFFYCVGCYEAEKKAEKEEIENERCGVCDQDAYHQNDWHCSQGLIGPKRKEWFDVKEEEEEDCECGNNKHKGIVNNEMRCEDCDIDGINYNGGLTEEEEELIECHDCGTMSQLFYKHQGVSVGGVVYDISIGKCCEKHY